MSEFKPVGSQDSFREAHKQSDVDADQQAQHHTLGGSPVQAAPGNHKHDNLYSPLGHTHPISDVVGLNDALADKEDVLIGEVKEFPVGTIPSKFLEFNGQSVLRADYPDLFALWGTTFGSASGTTFNVGPVVADKMPIGNSGTKTVGTTGGSATTALPNHVHSDAHTHTIAHTHSIPGQVGAGFIGVAAGTVNVTRYSDYNGHAHGGDTGGSSAANTGARSVADTGNPTTNPNIAIDPPWYATRKIVRALL